MNEMLLALMSCLLGGLLTWLVTRFTSKTAPTTSSDSPPSTVHSSSSRTLYDAAPPRRVCRLTSTEDEHSLPTVTLASDCEGETKTKSIRTGSPSASHKSCQADDSSSTSPMWMSATTSTAGRCAKSDSTLTELVADRRLNECSTEDVLRAIELGLIKPSQLEKCIGNELKAVHFRRSHLVDQSACSLSPSDISQLPYKHMDYEFVSNTCCENVLGYIPIPCGYAGPLPVNGVSTFVPLATTEGCLVASINRGCAAIRKGCKSGVRSTVFDDAMTRAPVVSLPSPQEALLCKMWLERGDNFRLVKDTFDATSRFARLLKLKIEPVGSNLYIRFCASTGDAMGMNMISKGVDVVLTWLQVEHFPRMKLLSVSSNYCTDKKHAAINWNEGRGKSVSSTCTIDASTVASVLKTSVDAMVSLCHNKCQVGSALAGGTAGSQNCHAANMVTAIFIATGQDVAQNVTSSACQTTMSRTKEGDLQVSCLMKCVEVGTVGGGTILPAQRAALQMMGVAGPNRTDVGGNSRRLAEIVCATVLAGEINLLAALTSGDLVKSHMVHNRSTINLLSVSNTSPLSSASSSPRLSPSSSGLRFRVPSSPPLIEVGGDSESMDDAAISRFVRQKLSASEEEMQKTCNQALM